MRTFLAFACAFAFGGLLLACGDKITTGGGGPKAVPAAIDAGLSAKKATGPEYSESDFVENDRNRDPFRNYAATFLNNDSKKSIEPQRPVLLKNYSLDELKLVAIVQSGDYPRAMVIDPTGKGWVLKRGDFLGRPETVHTGGTNGTDYQLNWRVDRVRDGDVVLVREDPAQPNLPPATRVMPLHADSEMRKEQEGMGLSGGQL